MIRIIMATKLAALRAEAGQAPALRQEIGALGERAAAAEREAASAQAAAGRARADHEALVNDTAATLRALKAATEHPVHGQNIRADIALTVMRLEVERIKAEGDPEAIGSVRILGWLLGPDPDIAADAPHMAASPNLG